VAHLPKFVEQLAEVQSGADHADWSGQNVVEHQCRDGQARHEASHGVAHHDIHSAAHEHAARFQVHGTHRETEEHDREDEPRRAFSDGVLGNAARIKSG
jgi:hypothetical protein